MNILLFVLRLRRIYYCSISPRCARLEFDFPRPSVMEFYNFLLDFVVLDGKVVNIMLFVLRFRKRRICCCSISPMCARLEFDLPRTSGVCHHGPVRIGIWQFFIRFRRLRRKSRKHFTVCLKISKKEDLLLLNIASNSICRERWAFDKFFFLKLIAPDKSRKFFTISPTNVFFFFGFSRQFLDV